jgi:predicted  nucleic acid-binding Zn-ribbon protein
LHETRISELQVQLSTAQKELTDAREAYGRAKATEESLAQQLSEAKSAQQHSEAKLTRLLDNTPNPKEATETNRLELEVSLAKADIQHCVVNNTGCFDND